MSSEPAPSEITANHFILFSHTNDESHIVVKTSEWRQNHKTTNAAYRHPATRFRAMVNLRFRYRMPFDCWFIYRVRDCVRILQDPRHYFVSSLYIYYLGVDFLFLNISRVRCLRRVEREGMEFIWIQYRKYSVQFFFSPISIRIFRWLVGFHCVLFPPCAISIVFNLSEEHVERKKNSTKKEERNISPITVYVLVNKTSPTTLPPPTTTTTSASSKTTVRYYYFSVQNRYTLISY